MTTTKHSDVEIRPSEVARNGLFATKAVKQGDIIWLRSRPLIAELKSEQLLDSCANCFLGPTEAELKAYEPTVPFVTACTGCRKVRYCSKACQREAWKRSHKYECKILAMPGLPDLMPECRAAILLYHLIQSPNTSEVEKMQLTNLYSTYEEMAKDFRKGSSVGNVGPILMSNEIANRITRHTEAMASESKVLNPYFAQIVNNALEIPHSVTMVDIGIAVDPIACAANHSCAPNASVGFDGPAIYIQAEMDIAADEEIFFSYCDPHNVLEQRQAILKNRYYFDCRCTKCIDQMKQIKAPGADRSTDALELRVSNLLKTNDGVIANFSHQGLQTYCREIDKSMAEMRDAGWAASHPVYGSARDNLITALSYTDRHMDLLRQTIKRHIDIDPARYPEKNWVRQAHVWELVQIIRLVQRQNGNDQVTALLRGGFDFIPALWKIHDSLLKDLKDTQCRDRFSFVVEQQLIFMQTSIESAGFAALRAIKEDRDGQVERFTNLKDALEF